MAETLATWFVEHLSGSVSREMIVFIVSLLPILELRGGIIAGFAMGMHWLPTFIIAYIGNLLPDSLYFVIHPLYLSRTEKNTSARLGGMVRAEGRCEK